MKFESCRSLALKCVTGFALASLTPCLTSSSYATLSFESLTTSAQNNAVHAKADITISGNTLTVKLTDLLADPHSAANTLSGIEINISGVTGVSGFGANDAMIADIGGGSYTPTSTSGANLVASDAWKLTYSNPTIKLTALNHQPDYTIVGPDSNGNFTSGIGDPGYTNANSSITGDSHNPVILGEATFYMTLSGSSPFLEDNISKVTFLFGTGSDSADSTIVPVPEPSTVVAGALLLLPLGVSVVRIMRKQRAVAQKI